MTDGGRIRSEATQRACVGLISSVMLSRARARESTNFFRPANGSPFSDSEPKTDPPPFLVGYSEVAPFNRRAIRQE